MGFLKKIFGCTNSSENQKVKVLEKNITSHSVLSNNEVHPEKSTGDEILAEKSTNHEILSANQLSLVKDAQINSSPSLASSQLLLAIQDEFVDLKIKSDPVIGPVFGIKKYEDDIFNSSKEYLLKMQQFYLDLKFRLLNLDATTLSEAEVADLQFTKNAIITELLELEAYTYEIPSSHQHGPLDSIALEFEYYQPLESRQDIENYKKRLEKFLPRFNDIIDGFKEGVKNKITLPKESIDILIESVIKNVTENVSDSPFNRKEKALELTGDEKFLEETIEKYVNPAFKAVDTYLRTEYVHHARKYPGIYGLRDSEAVYQKLISIYTSVDYKPDELHQIGLAEVDRINKLKAVTQQEILPNSTIEEFQKAINNKELYPQLYFDDNNKIVGAYKSLLDKIDSITPKYFRSFPKFRQCAIEAVPENMEAGAPLAFYQAGTATKCGSFKANMLLHKDHPVLLMTAITLHEANPGHHHQLSLALETEGEHLIKKLVMVTSFVEGWGLYCEYLGEEMGLYEDKLQYYGRLELEMFRALRLVIDTGLHAKGWSVEKCLDFMKQYIITMSEAELLSEIKRYSSIPGQALAYKVGEIKIKEIRKFAESELGSKFNIIEFHEKLLSYGNIPLAALEMMMKKWVEDLKN
ncbi:hypothetical protein HK099_003469 [Clydaea vesicula]|uniref:DUF885 domain-containing protein n=1 Tax=Clydaea vesicula TaxID=447962 RepID=A0AAD5U1K9_9FUNG|nr:hypothetical protein HK099_003469 [Clydaea vesicula]